MPLFARLNCPSYRKDMLSLHFVFLFYFTNDELLKTHTKNGTSSFPGLTKALESKKRMIINTRTAVKLAMRVLFRHCFAQQQTEKSVILHFRKLENQGRF